jgi:hypothetical protein
MTSQLIICIELICNKLKLIDNGIRIKYFYPLFMILIRMIIN